MKLLNLGWAAMQRTGQLSASDLDRLFTLVCRASPDEARELAGTVPPEHRARIALFCYARTHLRDVGRAMASACDEASLALEGGLAGIALYAQRTVASERTGSRAGGSRISIARLSEAGSHSASDDLMAAE